MSQPLTARRMRPGRTANQTTADQFDAHLYRLINSAECYATSEGGWSAVARLLKSVRPHVRKMMHADDQNETS